MEHLYIIPRKPYYAKIHNADGSASIPSPLRLAKFLYAYDHQHGIGLKRALGIWWRCSVMEHVRPQPIDRNRIAYTLNPMSEREIRESQRRTVQVLLSTSALAISLGVLLFRAARRRGNLS